MPHIGWNQIHDPCRVRNFRNGGIVRKDNERSHSFDILLPGAAGVESTAPPACYFVHSYYLPPCAETVATCDYSGVEISAIVRGTKANRHIWGCQFHPEKSARLGSQILRNWLQHADAV